MRGKPTAVEAAFTARGEVTPLRFDWGGSRLTVEGVGRRWTESEHRCFNVSAMGGRLFELRFDADKLQWSVARGPIPKLTV